ncbi:hypothetical protein COK80_25990 [Bacillus anthracis]|nr:hypothetical protein COK80_25990 [Bacillus anthracis]
MNDRTWALSIGDNPSVVHWELGPHFHFWDGDNGDGPPVPLFSSRHVNILDEKDSLVAYARLKTIFRIVNGLSMLIRARRSYSLETLYFYKDDIMRDITIQRDSTILLRELQNPFNEDITREIDDQTKSYPWDKRYLQNYDYAELAVKDDLVREVILLLSLVVEDELYLLVNAYKILEIIRNDVGFKQKDGRLVENDISKAFPFENLFILQGFAGYINNKGASGILSRHGFSKNETKMDVPPYEDFIDIVVKSVSEWINYKCHLKFNRQYLTAKSLLRFEEFDVDHDFWDKIEKIFEERDKQRG